MTDQEAAVVHDCLTQLQNLTGKEQEAYFAKGQLYNLLYDSKAWKGFYPEAGRSWRKFLVASGLKPTTVESCRKVTARFGPIVTREALQVIPSRLEALLPIVGTQEGDLSMVKELAESHIPHDAFAGKLAQLKGKPDVTICDHINVPENKREQWIKHTCCGAWVRVD